MKPLAELIGDSPGVVAVREKIGRLLGHQSDRSRFPPLLIQGETGTGKGLLARAIHRAGPRANGPFVDINCAAIPETLLEAELFGYERGAFTDARHAKAGLFQVAHHGTLFLDEVGLLPEALQAKLLKVIEERAVRRLGATRSETVDVFILTASNVDLAAAARDRRFREDLYHRLAVVTLWLPPLRERGDDVLRLAEHFVARSCAEYDLRPKTLTADARAALLAYPWPGNIRELANVLERVALLTEASAVTAEALGLSSASAPGVGAEPPGSADRSLESAMGSVERAHLLDALRETRWNITHAAARLGISRDTLRYRITKHGLRPDGPEAPARRRPERSAATASPGGRAVTVSPASATVRWEQRRLTLLRAALVLPPGTDPRLSPSRVVESLVEKVKSFGGRVEELSPSGLVGVFGLEPVEDAPRRGAHAAMAILKAVERARQETGEAVAARCALGVRTVLVGAASAGAQIDLDGKREAWQDLDTLLAGAELDSIAVGEAARPFLERHFDLLPAGGRAYRLAASEQAGLGLGRRMATFVGRANELDLLRSRLDSAMRGHGQVVGILGEAGIGKSRLLFEFRRMLHDMREAQDLRVTCLEGRCHSYGSAIPYLPVLDIVRQSFRLAETDSPAEIADKVRRYFGDLGLEPDESAPYLLRLLGVPDGVERLQALSPGAIKARTFEALRQLTLESARRRPIVFLVEDLHWIDATSEECFAALMESTAGAPAMVIATYRPGYRPPWADKSYATQVALQPLSPEDGVSLVRSVMERDDVPEPLSRLLVEKTEGNPFFLEELARAVGESADLRLPATVPDTIQEVLLARIDRLQEAPKRLLQTAAVLGREVPATLLGAIWEGPDLEAPLRELMRLEFLYRQTGGPEPVYAFTHTLTQEVAYETLPIARRQSLHRAAGQALERIHAGRLDEADERLAYHFARTDEADRAITYLTRVADRAARGHAHREAVRILDEALEHVGRVPAEARGRQRLDLVLGQAESLIPLGGFRKIVDRLLRNREDLERLRDPARGGRYHFLLGRSYLFLGDDERAVQHAAAGIIEATAAGDEATVGKIHYVLAQRGAMSGQPREGLDHGQQAVRIFERLGEGWWLGPARWAVGLNLALLGRLPEALEMEAVASASAEDVGDPQLVSAAAWATGIILAALGDREGSLASCELALDRAPDPLNVALAMGWLGYAHLEGGDPVQAIPRLERAVELLGRFSFPQPQASFIVFLAEAHGLMRQLERALELAGQGLAQARAANALYAVAWAEQTLGRVAQARGALDDARTHLEEALAIFAAMDAGYYAARTRLDLARLARAQGRPDEAARHLAEADRLFRQLAVPRWIERTATLGALGSDPADPSIASTDV